MLAAHNADDETQRRTSAKTSKRRGRAIFTALRGGMQPACGCAGGADRSGEIAHGDAGERDSRRPASGWTCGGRRSGGNLRRADYGLAGVGGGRTAAAGRCCARRVSLRGIPYSRRSRSIWFTTKRRSGKLPEGFGFLVPAVEGRAMLACTFVHRKFLGRTPPGKAVFRAFLGGMNVRRCWPRATRRWWRRCGAR